VPAYPLPFGCLGIRVRMVLAHVPGKAMFEVGHLEESGPLPSPMCVAEDVLLWTRYTRLEQTSIVGGHN